MKYILFFILIIIFFDNGQSQTIVKENKLWSNTEIGTEQGSQYNSYYIKFQGDTTISNIHYKKIYKSEDELHLNWYINGFIREDSTKKVFTYSTYYNEDEILYNFDLRVGDTVKKTESYDIIVHTIKSIVLENSSDTVKQINLTINNSDDIITTWIEGLGSTDGILNGLNSILVTGVYYKLVCYYNNDTLKYHDPDFETCFPQGFPEKIIKNLRGDRSIRIVYDEQQLIFEFSELNTSQSKFQIYNLNGILVNANILNGENRLIYLKEEILPGFYIYTFQKDKIILSGVFVVR